MPALRLSFRRWPCRFVCTDSAAIEGRSMLMNVDIMRVSEDI